MTTLKILPADLKRFKNVAIVKDPAAFTTQLQALVDEKMAEFKHEAEVETLLAEKVSRLRARVRWQPDAAALERGRVAQLETFNDPGNLPLVRFAQLSNKSRQQVYKDIAARRLLSLQVGSRKQRVPAWQLEPYALKLTQQVLDGGVAVDVWTLYHALSDPLNRYNGRSAVAMVNASNLDEVRLCVLSDLGFQV